MLEKPQGSLKHEGCHEDTRDHKVFVGRKVKEAIRADSKFESVVLKTMPLDPLKD
jgi:hypothetical protein